MWRKHEHQASKRIVEGQRVWALGVINSDVSWQQQGFPVVLDQKSGASEHDAQFEVVTVRFPNQGWLPQDVMAVG